MKYMSIAEIVGDVESRPVETTGHVYHPIPFPEFSHLTTSSSAIEVTKKWSIIQKTLDDLFPLGLHDLKLLDIGANAGFYTFSFAKQGARVTAFEPHPRYSDIGRVIAKEKALPVEWHGMSFRPEVVAGNKFDVAFMLSVFQWMAAGGAEVDKASRELRHISEISNFLFFELGFNSGKSCMTTNGLNHYAKLVEFLRNNTRYRHFKLLGKTRLWRGSSRFLVVCSNDDRFDDGFLRKIVRSISI